MGSFKIVLFALLFLCLSLTMAADYFPKCGRYVRCSLTVSEFESVFVEGLVHRRFPMLRWISVRV